MNVRGLVKHPSFLTELPINKVDDLDQNQTNACMLAMKQEPL